jgi:uncharacterized protein (TIGR02001 family)
MKKTRTLLAAPVLLATLSGPAFADQHEEDTLPGTFSGSVGLFNDYRFRGISQTDEKPALQGSLEYSIDSGLYGLTPYVGFWGSNVDFADGDEATLEVDVLFGLRGAIGDTGVSYDIGGIYYAYPDANKADGEHLNYDYWEAAFLLGYEPTDIIGLSGGYFYSPDFFGGTDDAHYFTAGVSLAPPIEIHDEIGLSVFANIGHQMIEEGKDYTDWNIGFGVSYKMVEFTLSYVDTDLSQSDLGSSIGDAGVVFGVSASF